MALNKEQLEGDILNLITDMRERTEVSDQEYAQRLANAIDAYVKTATIQYTNGLVAPNGAVTGTFNGNLE